MQKRFLLSLSTLAICLTMQAQWSLSGNSNATTSSKLGTTNSIPLRLLTNNIERIRIATDGKVGVGTITPQQRLHVEGTSNQAIFVNTSTVGPLSGSGMIGYVKGLPTGAGNRLGYFLLGSRGGANANYNAAGMAGYAAGSWTAGASHPAYLTFETTPHNSTSRVESMRINEYGNVGIGTNSPVGRLHVVGEGPTTVDITNSFESTEYHGIGIQVYASPNHFEKNNYGMGVGVRSVAGFAGLIGIAYNPEFAPLSYGVFGRSSNKAGQHFGVYGISLNNDLLGEGDLYGIYGKAVDGYFNAAGYFDGDVYATEYYTTSDRKFKNNIAPMENALASIMKLKPSTYEFKTAEFPRMALAKGQQLGLIADEVKKVFPGLVKEAVHPAQYDDETKKVVSTKVQYEAVNYQGLIPVLVASIQEQETKIEKQMRDNEELKLRIAKLEEIVSKFSQGNSTILLSNANLGTASPNPVNGSATVSYSIPEGSRTAHIVVTDLKGSIIKQVNISGKGTGQVQLNTTSLAAGTYTYSLFVDGSKVETRQLLVAR